MHITSTHITVNISTSQFKSTNPKYILPQFISTHITFRHLDGSIGHCYLLRVTWNSFGCE
jgi:hypothetical protein